MRTFTLACFIFFVFLLLACLFTANAKDAGKQPAEKKLEASGNRLTVRSEKNGKKTAREFPMMFDIAERSAKAKKEKTVKSPGAKAPAH